MNGIFYRTRTVDVFTPVNERDRELCFPFKKANKSTVSSVRIYTVVLKYVETRYTKRFYEKGIYESRISLPDLLAPTTSGAIGACTNPMVFTSFFINGIHVSLSGDVRHRSLDNVSDFSVGFYGLRGRLEPSRIDDPS